MQTVKVSALAALCVCVVLVTGCVQENSLRIQNATQRTRIEKLESEIQTNKLTIDQLQRKIQTADSITGTETEALKQIVTALEEDIAKKKTLINSMQQQLLSGGGALPVELSTMLEDFAESEGMVTFESNRGVVKFNSDLLFEKGSDTVVPVARSTVEAFCRILNTEQGKSFDIIIAGHTDDLRIGKPETREKHPSNWHLSAHRAIAVLNVMTKNKIVSERLSIRGFGEYRPIEPNKPNQKGNPQNRRVEIYIVPKGT